MRRLRLFPFLLLLLMPAALRAQDTVTGHVTLPSGTAPSNVKVCFTLSNFSPNAPRVINTGTLVAVKNFCITPAADGSYSTALFGNDTIAPISTNWRVDFLVNGQQQSSATYYVNHTPFNLDTEIPLSVTTPAGPNQMVTQAFPFTQLTPATTWTITHNFNDSNTIVSAADANGQQIFPDTVNCRTNPNVCTLTFISATSGFAIAMHAGAINIATTQPNAIVSNSLVPQIINNQPTNFRGLITSPNINSILTVDGITYATLADCYAAIPVNGGTCVVPPNHVETMPGSLTMNKSDAGFLIYCGTTVSMAANQIIVPGGVHGAFIKGECPFGGGGFVTGKGVTFTYTGSGKAFQVGDGAGTTNRAFEFSDITVDLSGASSGASGLYMTNVVYFKLITPSFVGNNSTTGTKGIVCDGTGNFCGSGAIINPYISGLGTGILGTGPAGNGMNAAMIAGGSVSSSVAGAIGLDIENGDSSSVDGLDLESLAVAVKLGANAAGNVVRIRQEANTMDVQALSGSRFNVVQVERANVPVVSDAGTSNQFYRMQDGGFLNVYTPLIQSPVGGNTAMADNASVTQAAVVPGAFEVFNIFALATGAKIEDAPTGTHAGVTFKSGSGGGNYTGTNTGYANVDTTNLCTVFTIPTGWKLSVTVSGAIESVTAAVAQSFALSDIGTTCGGAGTTPLAGSERTYTPPAIAAFDVGLSTQAVINGDSAAHAISLQAKTSNAADAWGIQNTSSSAAPSMIFSLEPSN